MKFRKGRHVGWEIRKRYQDGSTDLWDAGTERQMRRAKRSMYYFPEFILVKVTYEVAGSAGSIQRTEKK